MTTNVITLKVTEKVDYHDRGLRVSVQTSSTDRHVVQDAVIPWTRLVRARDSQSVVAHTKRSLINTALEELL